MATATRKAETDPAAQLDLRRLLFELLALCGMDRGLGFTRQVDAQGRIDAVVEARAYLQRPLPRLEAEPLQPAPRRWHDTAGVVMVTVVQIAMIAALIWAACKRVGQAPVWIVFAATAVVAVAWFIPRPRPFQADLGDDQLYRTWLSLLVRALDGSATGHRRTARQALRWATNYANLCPAAWRAAAAGSPLQLPLAVLAQVLILAAFFSLFF